MSPTIHILISIFVIIAVAVNGGFANHGRLRSQLHSNPTKYQHRIIGGKPFTIEQAPWQAAILNISGEHFCGGSILNDKTILSACHCFDSNDVSDIRVRVGSSYTNRDGSLIEIQRVILHPRYNIGIPIDFDFAIVKLAISVNSFTNIPKPIGLPKNNASVQAGTRVLVTGWGYTQYASGTDQLSGIVVTIQDQKWCKETYGKEDAIISDRMFCAGDRNERKDACRKDSGGPAASDGILLGVVSWGASCGYKDYPTVYAKVSTVRDWIDLFMD